MNSLDNYNKEEQLLDLKVYIQNFVFCNWKNLYYRSKTEDIVVDLELDEEEYINEDEIFYKGILYI